MAEPGPVIMNCGRALWRIGDSALTAICVLNYGHTEPCRNERGQRVADAPAWDANPRLWAMDLDGESRPVYAHLIVASEPDDDGRAKAHITACGKRLDRGNHPRGWRGTEGGRLPLQEHAIHCGGNDPHS